MLRRRWPAGLAVVVTAVAVTSAVGFPAAAGHPSGRIQGGEVAASALEMFSTPPTVVRAGERVTIPVHAVCATTAGRACQARVTLGVVGQSGRWESYSAPASADLRFDVTAPAVRAVESAAVGSVPYFLRAQGGGLTRSYPSAEAAAPLRFYVTRQMPVVDVPPIAFGRVVRPRTVLSLPWGSGPRAAGLDAAPEAATVGPSSFDVDARGRVWLLDAMQARLALFDRGRLVRQYPVSESPLSDLAVADDGTAFVLRQHREGLSVERFDPSGRADGTESLGSGVLSEIRMAGSRAYVEGLPLDAWVPVRMDGSGAPPDGEPAMGMPLRGGGQLLRTATGQRLRLGIVRRGAVDDAVELRFSQGLGEIALAEPDGRGGYWAVAHVWREAPAAADQYQVIHVRGTRILANFAVGDQRFALTAPLSKFRLGRDGRFYELLSGPAGVRVVSFGQGGQS